jgi:ATP-dependent RNA helicase RhlE
MSLVCVDELKLLKSIEQLIKRDIPKDIIENFEPDPSIKPEPIKQHGRSKPQRNTGKRNGNRSTNKKQGAGRYNKKSPGTRGQHQKKTRSAA